MTHIYVMANTYGATSLLLICDFAYLTFKIKNNDY